MVQILPLLWKGKWVPRSKVVAIKSVVNVSDREVSFSLEICFSVLALSVIFLLRLANEIQIYLANRISVLDRAQQKFPVTFHQRSNKNPKMSHINPSLAHCGSKVSTNSEQECSTTDHKPPKIYYEKTY